MFDLRKAVGYYLHGSKRRNSKERPESDKWYLCVDVWHFLHEAKTCQMVPVCGRVPFWVANVLAFVASVYD